jgi:hypothetical protein
MSINFDILFLLKLIQVLCYAGKKTNFPGNHNIHMVPVSVCRNIRGGLGNDTR